MKPDYGWPRHNTHENLPILELSMCTRISHSIYTGLKLETIEWQGENLHNIITNQLNYLANNIVTCPPVSSSRSNVQQDLYL